MAHLNSDKKRLKFYSLAHLEKWLNEHPDGKKILENIKGEQHVLRAVVLIVAHPDGYLEAYTEDRTIGIKFTEPLDVPPSQEIMAEHRMERELPSIYRAIYCPVNMRKSWNLRRRTISDELDRQTNMRLLRLFQNQKDKS